jgi:hypothetical protein
MRAIFKLEYWWAWLAIIIGVRLLAALFMSPPPALPSLTVDHLLPLAAQSDDAEVRELAWLSLRQVAIRYPEERTRMLTVLQKDLRAASNSQIVAWRLSHDPEVVLQEVARNYRHDWSEYVRLSMLVLCGSGVLFFAIVVPVLLCMAGGRHGLRKAFGRRVWSLLITIHLLLGASLSLACGGFLPLCVVQIVWCGCGLLVLWRVLHAGMLVVILGIPQHRMSQLFFAASGLAVLSLLPYLYQTPQPTHPLPPQQIMEAMRQAAQSQQKNVVPILLNILQYHSPSYTVAMEKQIQQEAIATLGVLGDETTVTALFSFLNSQQPELQKATLRALMQIWQRSAHK